MNEQQQHIDRQQIRNPKGIRSCKQQAIQSKHQEIDQWIRSQKRLISSLEQIDTKNQQAV